ncbi:MAG TPA: hypothetical protein VHM19_16540 [Polyangiales bacterium]|jgi:hypothetical protein|nr:hypothetical protein [Polyangiales bacterium]
MATLEIKLSRSLRAGFVLAATALALAACSMKPLSHARFGVHSAGPAPGAVAEGGTASPGSALGASGSGPAAGAPASGGSANQGYDAGTYDVTNPPPTFDAAISGMAHSDAGATQNGTPRSSVHIFNTAHSHADDPLMDDIVSIAQSLGSSAEYNEQIVIGSPMRVRTRGNNPDASGWAGYSLGKNRGGSTGLNVIDELRAPATLSAGARYDVLLAVEAEGILDAIRWEDSARYVRHFHERLIEGNPAGTTYLYSAWLDIDPADPAAFVSYERDAIHAWECLATRIDVSLAAEGRSDRLIVMPASLALAALVERAYSAQGLTGITGATPSTTHSAIFRDDVHLQPVAMYYIALVSYSAIFGSSPLGAWAPGGVSGATASELQQLAWTTVSDYYATAQPFDLAGCSAFMRNGFCASYENRVGASGATQGCDDYFARTDSSNGLYYDAANDAQYWFPAPP